MFRSNTAPCRRRESSSGRIHPRDDKKIKVDMRRRARSSGGRGRSTQHRPEPEFVGHPTPSDQESAARNSGFDESRRRDMIRKAELIAKAIQQRIDAEKMEERAREADLHAEAAEKRRDSKPPAAVAVQTFAGATEEVVATMPRIPKKPEVTYISPKSVSDSLNSGDDVVSTDSTDAQRELADYLFQEAGLEKPVAAVGPHSHRDRPPTLPIESRMSEIALDWDEDDLPAPAPRSASVRRGRQRSTSRQHRDIAPVVVGPPGVPRHELAGSLDSAPGEGRHRKKKQEYNPRRHLQADDFEPFCLDNPPPHQQTKAAELCSITVAGPSRIRWSTTPKPPPSEGGRGQKFVDTEIPRGTESAKPFGKMYPPRDNIPPDELDPPRTACWNCWNRYHIRSGCTKAPSLFCKNCGRRDTMVERCPRCGPDYHSFLVRERIRKQVRYEQKRKERRDAAAERDGRWDDNPVRPSRAPSGQRRDTSTKRGRSSSRAEQFRPGVPYDGPSTSSGIRHPREEDHKVSHRSRSHSRRRSSSGPRTLVLRTTNDNVEPPTVGKTTLPAGTTASSVGPTTTTAGIVASLASATLDSRPKVVATSAVDNQLVDKLDSILTKIQHYPQEQQWLLLQGLGFGVDSSRAPGRSDQEDEKTTRSPSPKKRSK